MRYTEAIQAVDTERALEVLGLETKRDGSYIHFTSLCGHDAVIRTHGEKKNLIFCPTCKKGSNIFTLALDLKGINFADLVEKAGKPQKPIEEELNLNYTLEWCVEMEKEDLNQELCQRLGVGKPKGKTMLSGTIAFTVFNENGLKVAYFGLKPDGTKKFHQSFNPELYLYNVNNCDPREEVWLTTDMLRCLKHIQDGRKALCNFGLPYLSPKQYEMLNLFQWVTIEWLFTDQREISVSVAQNLKAYHRFV